MIPRSRWSIQASARSVFAVSRRSSSVILPDQKPSSANFNSRWRPMRGKPREPTERVLLDIVIPHWLVGAWVSGRVRPSPSKTDRSNHRDTPPVDVVSSWQVSWLTGRHCCPSSQGRRLSDILDSGSPLTVAGAAPALPNDRRTGFPLSPGEAEPLQGTTTSGLHGIRAGLSIDIKKYLCLYVFFITLELPAPPRA